MVKRVINQGRVGLGGAGSIPRIQVSTAAARNLQRFAEQSFAMAANYHDQLDAKAEAEGKTAGALDGMSGDPTLQSYSTIRGRAHNQAAITTFATTMETQAITTVAQLEAKYANDPDQLATALDEYGKGVFGKLKDMDPTAANAFEQRLALRKIPAVERAKDARFKHTRDQAEAALITNQVAIEAELKSISGDLFSENPERSSAAANQVSALQSQIMGVYNATDANGVPLYSAVEKAEALQKFQGKVFETATLSWFSAQADPVGAYFQFLDDGFSINLDAGVPNVEIIEDLDGKIRDKPITGALRGQIQAAAGATMPGLAVRVVSGGQEPGKGTGSPRHDHGASGDLVLVRNGKDVLPDEDPELYERFLENAAAAGATGIGHYPWGVHIGGGSVAAWGPDKTSKSLDPRFGAAIERGRKGERIATEPSSTKIDIRKALDPATLARIDQEMRSQISFKNTLDDRNRLAEERELKQEQDLTYFNLTDRLIASPSELTELGAAPVTSTEIREAVKGGLLSADQGRAMANALDTENSEKSDPLIEKELIARMFRGEDVQNDILNAKGRLTGSDMKSLLTQNRTLNGADDGEFTKPQKFYFDQLKSTLISSDMFDFNPMAEQRKSNGLIEYKKRVDEGEDPETVMRDVIDRANRENVSTAMTATAKLLAPRFSTVLPDGSVDVRASALALHTAHKANRISDESFERQIALLRQWDIAQQTIAKGAK